MKETRVRFAPSPTGPLHIGGVRTALFNYLFAKKNNGKFLLRIEDTDQTRYVKNAEEYIIKSLEWIGIKIDEGYSVGGELGPYKQSDRKPMYKQYAERLIKDGYAYYAFDTTEELQQMREDLKKANVKTPQYNAITRVNMKNSLTLSEDEVKRKLANNDEFVVRLKVPRNEEIKVFDEVRGWVVVHSSKIDDKVLLKKDAMPTYHLANVVDDYLMKITHVIRGEEWLPSAPLHLLLYRYLGWENEMPKFAHLPLILKPDGKGKLSKRDGDRLGFPVFPLEWTDPETKEVSSGYKEKGYFPEAFVNILALLGWNPGGTTQEIFSLDELSKSFSLKRVGKSGAKFDPVKAAWFNQQYLKNKSNEELTKKLKDAMGDKLIHFSNDYIQKVCSLMKDRAVFITDLYNEAIYFYIQPTSYDPKVIKKKWKEETPVLLSELKEKLYEMDKFNAETVEKVFKQYLDNKELKIGKLLNAFRLVVTGFSYGASMFDICELLGKNDVINRIENGIRRIKN